LGCGLALPSLVLAQKGLSVTATDFHPDVPWFLERNLAANGLSVQYQALDWQEGGLAADVLLGSEVVYDRRQPVTLVEFLKNAKWAEAVFADPGRPYWEAFMALAKKTWQVEEFLRDGIFFARLVADPKVLQ